MPVVRPARTTDRLQIPIPGDAGPADFVTDLGAAADRIDVAASGVPLIAPSDLSNPPYTTPYDGQTVDMLVDAAFNIVWRFRYSTVPNDGYNWMFVGGMPLVAVDGTSVALTTTFTLTNPMMYPPRPGFYRVVVLARVRCDTVNAVVSQALAHNNVQQAAAWLWAFTSQPTFALANTWVPAEFDSAPSAPLNLHLRPMVSVSGGTGSTSQRVMRLQPIRVS